MKIYIVSCNSGRVERLTNASKSLNLDFEVIYSLTGSDPEVQERGKQCFEKNLSFPNGFAATLGHLKAMKRLVDSGESHAMIIEDDVRFHKDFNKYIEHIQNYMIENKVDVTSIGFVNFPVGYTQKYILDIPVLETVGLGNPWGCQCYMISSEYANHLWNLFQDGDPSEKYSNNFLADWVLYDPILRCNRSTITIPICVESPSEPSTLGDNSNKPNLLATLNREDFLL
jgi:GR25 family glycosyltransferase involved in LPS biosynthesis